MFQFFRSTVLDTLKVERYRYSKIEKKTTLSSRQACFVIAHSSGDLCVIIYMSQSSFALKFPEVTCEPLHVHSKCPLVEFH